MSRDEELMAGTWSTRRAFDWIDLVHAIALVKIVEGG